ncbi:MAG: hypothetical protein K0R63_1005 [Rickettsiales bacterium]|jgi:cytoplasmic iron level regulating protein YaaA (DUF328/UPF0246 family)|nr:hypothetical protein [Rickettsiales bacterium]
MLLIISPSKKLDTASPSPIIEATMPTYIEEATQLAGKLKGFSEKKLAELMHVSPAIAKLNKGRYQEFSPPFSNDNAKQALLTFKGDVYANIDTASFTKDDFLYAQQHLRILSGLFGVLRPLDLIQPYRLDMGTPLPTPKGKNLYTFWGEKITCKLNEALKTSGSDLLLNLASQEYFASLQPKRVNGKVITVSFKEHRNGKFQTIGLLAKRARGMMTDYIIRNRIDSLDAILRFDRGGYHFNQSLSSGHEIVFSREFP